MIWNVIVDIRLDKLSTFPSSPPPRFTFYWSVSVVMSLRQQFNAFRFHLQQPFTAIVLSVINDRLLMKSNLAIRYNYIGRE